jgi:type IV secretory pathway TrbF-like protein
MKEDRVPVEPSLISPPEKSFAAARRQFVELYGSLAVMNTYLKIAVVLLAGACMMLALLNFRTLQSFRNFKPWVIRINDVGRAEAVRYTALEYQPRESEIRYFLSDFVERHYGRMRATLRNNYARSLYFLDGRLADSLIESNKKSGALEAFLTGIGEEIEVTVKNVVIEDLRESPYRATVDFEKAYLGADRSVLRRETYVANFVFVVKDQVPNTLVPVNPLGLTITYFRADQAFQ